MKYIKLLTIIATCLLVTSVFAVVLGVYPYDLWKSAPTSYAPVDLDVSATITPVTTYPMVYVSYGKMLQLYGGGATATMTFSVHVARKDTNNDVLLLATEVGLQRTNLTSLQTPAATYPSFQGPPWANPGGPAWFRDYSKGYEVDFFIPCQAPAYPTSVIVLLGPGASATPTLTWYENGVTSALPANATWAIGAQANIAQTGDASDTDLTNNFIGLNPATYNCTALTLTKEIPHGSSTYDKYTVLIGDINGDGMVDIYDAIRLSNAFGTKLGDKGWNPDADLMPDGVVDWSDWLLLSSMFNRKITNPGSSVLGPIAWNLTISTPLGQTQNDTVVILSNYIVYSDYSFNTTLKQLSFNIASSIDGFCNVAIPETSMSGAFTVYLDDVPTPSVITSNVPGDLSFWNGYAEGADYLNISATRYFIYFDTTGLSQKVRIVSEYVNKILGDADGNGWVNVLDAIDLSNSFGKSTGQTGFNPDADFDHSGVVNVLDAITLATHYDWRNP
jgi:hypothetical protein